MLAACQQTGSPGVSTQPTTKAAGALRSTPTPATTPAPAPALILEKVGASTSPSGFLAFAVINNPSAETAINVEVEITAVDGSGQALARRSGKVARVPPGQREAVAVAFPVPRSLPSAFTGRVLNVGWTADTSADAAQVADASFVQDARTPAVRVHLVNHGQTADRVMVTAICWDAAGEIRGGGTSSVMVGPDAQGHDVTIQVAIATVPARCDAYGISTS